jgi:hypothetical protein
MKKYYLIGFSLLTISVFAQRTTEAEKFINAKEFEKAYAIFEKTLTNRALDAKSNFLFAICCYELKKDEQAITHFELAGQRFPLRSMYLGELYYRTYRFDLSVIAFQNYITTLPAEDPKIDVFKKKLEKAEMAARLLNRVEDVTILDSVLVNKSTFLDMYSIGAELGSIKTKKILVRDSTWLDKITYTTERKDRMIFSDTVQGQMDLFTSFKLLDSWSKPLPLPADINSTRNENYPFLLLDGITLYFASDNEKSLGGYDIFVTQYNPSSQTYLAPENIGFPFNSIANDYMMVIDEYKKIGWFATDRNQTADKVMIYTFVVPEQKKIIRTEEVNELRNIAMLKKYKTQELSLTEKKTYKKYNYTSNAPKEIFRFVINDSLVYTKIEDFQSDEAKRLLIQWERKYYELKNIEFHIDELKNEYIVSTSVDEKNKLHTKIIDMESKINELTRFIDLNKIELCNEELKFINKQSKQNK